MSTTRAMAAILQADLRQRMRTPRFWVVVMALGAVMWWCFPPAQADYLTVSVGDGIRGRYSSAWIGMVVGLIYGSLLPLAGFYLVRGTLTRDLDTRAWQLLVATTMSRTAYLVAKWLSHMAVFGLVIAVGLGFGLVMQFLRAEDTTVDVVELLKPVLVLAIPSLSLTAAFALWFDLVPWLRRSAGNVLFFFLWVTLVSVGLASADAPRRSGVPFPGDQHGLALVEHDLSQWPQARAAMLEKIRSRPPKATAPAADARAIDKATLTDSLGLNVGSQSLEGQPPTVLEWTRWKVSGATLAARGFWLLVGVLVLLGSVPVLDRFAAHTGSRTRTRTGGATLRWLDVVLAPLQRNTSGALLAAELRLVLRSRRWWWWIAMTAMFVTQLAAPDKGLVFGIIGAWLLCLDVFSRVVLREQDTRTAALVFTAPGMRSRLLATRVVMAIGLAWLVTLPAILRLAAVNPEAAVATVLAGASMAVWGLACGAVFRNARPFELALLATGYVSVQGAQVLNTLVAPGTTALWHAALLPVAVALLALAWRQGLAARA